MMSSFSSSRINNLTTYLRRLAETNKAKNKKMNESDVFTIKWMLINSNVYPGFVKIRNFHMYGVFVL